MTSPTPATYTHVATTVSAIQFDGTVNCLLAIFNAVTPNPAGVQVVINFNGSGGVDTVTFNGPAPLNFKATDWVLMPTGAAPSVMADGDFQASWQ